MFSYLWWLENYWVEHWNSNQNNIKTVKFLNQSTEHFMYVLQYFINFKYKKFGYLKIFHDEARRT